jgi:archaellum component FlaG (FlaF/FlaG flagellin family)
MARFWLVCETEKFNSKQIKFQNMKKVLFTLSIFTAALTVGAQTEKPTAPATQTSLAEMTFETDVHDFGTIDYAGNGTYEFKFKNTGKEPLIITDAKGSCGCTVPTYPKNVPIKPGDSQVIKVTYDTKRAGNFTKTVTIHSNAKTGEKVLTIKGHVEPAAVEEAFPANGKKDDGATPFEKH